MVGEDGGKILRLIGAGPQLKTAGQIVGVIRLRGSFAGAKQHSAQDDKLSVMLRFAKHHFAQDDRFFNNR